MPASRSRSRGQRRRRRGESVVDWRALVASSSSGSSHQRYEHSLQGAQGRRRLCRHRRHMAGVPQQTAAPIASVRSLYLRQVQGVRKSIWQQIAAGRRQNGKRLLIDEQQARECIHTNRNRSWNPRGQGRATRLRWRRTTGNIGSSMVGITARCDRRRNHGEVGADNRLPEDGP
jgi:hypothetical protein